MVYQCGTKDKGNAYSTNSAYRHSNCKPFGRDIHLSPITVFCTPHSHTIA